MSMLVTMVVPEGIVMAADSAISTFKMMDMINLTKGNYSEFIKNTFEGSCALEKENIIGNKIVTKSACKLRIMKGNNIAFSDGNQRNFKNISLAPYLEYFCQHNNYDDPKSCADGLLLFIKSIYPNINAEYHICGYNNVNGIPQPEFWYVNVHENQVINPFGEARYAIGFCGANEYFSQYVPQINKNIFSYSLQDAIDITMFAIDMCIKLGRFIDHEELILPPVDLLVIEPTGCKWIQQKTLKTEGLYGGFC